ncbi:hypothetical protein [Desulfobaculum senezii]
MNAREMQFSAIEIHYQQLIKKKGFGCHIGLYAVHCACAGRQKWSGAAHGCARAASKSTAEAIEVENQCQLQRAFFLPLRILLLIFPCDAGQKIVVPCAGAHDG